MKRQELAPAKVNLTLDVGARRPDGYHEVVSVMQSVALYDTVTMESGTDVYKRQTLTSTPFPPMPAVRSTSRPRHWKRCWAGCTSAAVTTGWSRCSP